MKTELNIDYQKLKELSDFERLLPPEKVSIPNLKQDVKDVLPDGEVFILRMLVRAKYSNSFHIPPSLSWLEPWIKSLFWLDSDITGIDNKWAYVTVRQGIDSHYDNNWHLDGGSLRTELISERNYIWVSDYGFDYVTGSVEYPEDFDPVKQNLFPHILENYKGELHKAESKTWYLVHPFVFHRRSLEANGKFRTFIRVTFPDIEIRDVNCTQNPLLRTNAYGRDPVKSFRNKLI